MTLGEEIERASAREHVSLAAIAALFLKLGFIGFGGPAAHIAMMQDEVVERRKWLSREEFLDLVGATNLIPGPNSTELAIHVGHRTAGWPGLAVAGACFILPATLIVSAIAWAYVKFGTLPQVGGLLYGVKPVIIAVVLQAIWSLGRSASKTPLHGALAIATLALAILGVNELALLFGAGLVWAVRQWLSRSGGAAGIRTPGIGLFPAVGVPAAVAASGAGAAAASAGGGAAGASAVAASAGAAAASAGGAAAVFGLMPLFLFFLKVGSVIFGSGYVLLAFLEGDLVGRFHWLTRAQLLDAVAVGQITPGPVFTTATFVGYVLGGPAGAVVATLGIFLPAFVFVAISGPLMPRIRKSPIAGAALDGIVLASLALMAAVTFQLAWAAIVDPVTAALALVGAVMLVRFRVSSMWLVFGGALVGLLIRGGG